MDEQLWRYVNSNDCGTLLTGGLHYSPAVFEDKNVLVVDTTYGRLVVTRSELTEQIKAEFIRFGH